MDISELVRRLSAKGIVLPEFNIAVPSHATEVYVRILSGGQRL
jgi:hypothetical protein